ncbi:hypothetical protein CR513_55968, partial [Mucuna pruriens]
MMIKYIKKLEEKIEKLGGGLVSMWLDTQSVNAKVNALSKGKEKNKHKSSEGSHDKGYESHLSRSSRSKEEHERHKDELIKGKIPPFLGDGGLNAYYDWKMKVEQNLECYDCEDMVKVKLIAPSFEDKCVKDLYLHFTLNYKECIKDLKVLKTIQDIVELHDYTSLSILVHQATKVELQLKSHGRRSYPNTSSSWKGKERREDKPIRDKSPKKGSAPLQGRKEEVSISTPNTSKSSNIEYLKCIGKGHIAS